MAPTAPAAPVAVIGSRKVPVSAWAATVLVAGGFALLSGIPIAVATVAVVRDARLRALRWPAGLTAAAYATAVLVWRLGPDPEPSLTQSLSAPATVALAVLAAGTAIGYHLLRRRSRCR